MSRLVKRIMPFLSCDIPAIEKWLCDMAKNGLFYVENGPIFAKFERGEPKPRHYKLEYENIVASRMDADKQAMYEQFGWMVLDDIKTDLVVRYTDATLSNDEEEITAGRLSALERIQRKHFKLGILYLVLWLLSRNPIPVLKLAFGSQNLIISDLITVGTGKYIFLTVVGLFLLLEGIYRIIHSTRLKGYIESLRGKSKPKEYRSNTIICAIMTKLSVPLVVIWAASLFFANPFSTVFWREYNDVYEVGKYDFPLIDEINADEWRIIKNRNEDNSEPLFNIWQDDDLLAKRIYSIEQVNLNSDDGEYFEYTVDYFDLNKELYAQELMEEKTEEILNLYDKLDAEDYAADELKNADCNVKYFRDDTSNLQYLLVRCGSEFEEVYYCGESDLSQFADLFVSYLKN